MNMKDHMLAALKEEFDAWEKFLASLSEEQVMTQLAPSHWTIKDVVAHMMAWQQRSRARLSAARDQREPESPEWVKELHADPDRDADATNAVIYAAYRALPWAEVRRQWREGFRQLIELAQPIPESELLTDSEYSWLKPFSLADILIGTYDHHREHLEKTTAWLEQHDRRS